MRLLLITLALTFVARPGFAQDCEARESAAREAMEQWQLARAAELLRDALDACPSTRSAHNLAGVLRELGRPTEALELLDALLRDTYGELDEDEREAATNQRRETLSALATLDVLVDGAESGSVHVDGRPVDTFLGGSRRTIRLDPGEHRLQLRAPDFLPIDRDVTLVSGASDEVNVVFPEGDEALLVLLGPEGVPLRVDGEERGSGRVELRLASGAHSIAAQGIGERSVQLEGGVIHQDEFARPETPLRRRAWFWVLIGGSVLAVATATSIGVALSQDPNTLTHPVLGNPET